MINSNEAITIKGISIQIRKELPTGVARPLPVPIRDDTPSAAAVQSAAKHLIDLVGASLGLILLFPILMVIALLVRLTSPGPILFRQLRLGQCGRPFWFLKFRTMTADAEHRTDDFHKDIVYIEKLRDKFNLAREDLNEASAARFDVEQKLNEAKATLREITVFHNKLWASIPGFLRPLLALSKLLPAWARSRVFYPSFSDLLQDYLVKEEKRQSRASRFALGFSVAFRAFVDVTISGLISLTNRELDNIRIFKIYKMLEEAIADETAATARLRAAQSLIERYEASSGVLFKMRRDPRVTHLGRWLRRTGLDELPQLLNVLRGEMSLVGPRPLQMRDSALLEQLEPEAYARRLTVLPGLTGAWQVGGRSETDYLGMLRLDLDYIERWSLWRDITILFRTAGVVLRGRGAY